MSFVVELSPGGRKFVVEQGETILVAALRSGIALDHGCSNGSCGDCKARIVSGRVAQIHHHDYVLSAAARAEGQALLCCMAPLDDLVIEAATAHGPKDIPRQQITCRVHKLSSLTPDLMSLHLRTPRTRVLRFLSGQKVTLRLGEGGASATHWVASCACDGMNLRFHIPRATRDPFAEQVFAGLARGAKIDVEGPSGDFVLDESSPRATVFVAYDAAFAPISALIEHAINIDWPHPMRLYWYTPRPGGHYHDNYCRAWVDALDDFRFIPLTGTQDALNVGESLASHGARRVAARFADDRDELTDSDFYVAGPSDFVAALESSLRATGVAPEHRHTSVDK